MLPLSCPQVGAIRFDGRDRIEARLRLQQAQHAAASNPGPARALTHRSDDEEVYIAQLIQRAKLLNGPFQRCVVEAVGRLVGAAWNGPVGPDDGDNAGSGAVGEAGPVVFAGLGGVAVHSAGLKSAERMREKLLEYAPPHPGGRWPLCANITDPVRASVVCQGGAACMVRVVEWFVGGGGGVGAGGGGLPVVRVKNKFSGEARVTDGYRDVSLAVLYTHGSGLAIVGEIQIHDARLFDLKSKASARILRPVLIRTFWCGSCVRCVLA